MKVSKSFQISMFLLVALVLVSAPTFAAQFLGCTASTDCGNGYIIYCDTGTGCNSQYCYVWPGQQVTCYCSEFGWITVECSQQ